MAHLSERARLGLLSLLLLIMLGVLVFAAVNTVQAVKNFQHQYTAVKSENVSAIHPWMTIHVVSHIYHVPENYLYRTLNLPDTPATRHMTIETIALHKKQTTNQVIHTLQQAIVKYRKEHHIPTPTPQPGMKPPPPTQRRTSY
jgi:hypothetical protein